MLFESLFFGLFIGSFLNVIVCRLPRGESIVLPPSHCPTCNHRLGFWELFPVFSYLGLRGYCHYCKTKIGCRYPLVEVITGCITLLWWIRSGQFGLTATSFVWLILSYLLLVIALIDMDEQIIPDGLTLPFIGIGLIYRGLSGDIVSGIYGLLVGGGLLLLIYIINSQGIGLGDVKLLAMIGVFAGWEKVILILLLGSFIGVLIMVPMMIFQRRHRKTPFAFGPFLVLASYLAIYYWSEIIKLTSIFGS